MLLKPKYLETMLINKVMGDGGEVMKNIREWVGYGGCLGICW
jgi:hypothetical protein